MKSSLLSFVVSVFLSVSAFADTYKVTVTNLTKGQPITPPVVAVHYRGKSPIQLGTMASEGLAALAKDGKTDLFLEELNKDMGVTSTAVGDGVILPGQSAEIMVKVKKPYSRLTVVGMLARTNDAITLAKEIPLPYKGKIALVGRTYDAGAEENTESCSHIPAPPCANPMSDTETYEGFIRPHEGLLQIGDLNPARDAFANVTSMIVVEKVK